MITDDELKRWRSLVAKVPVADFCVVCDSNDEHTEGCAYFARDNEVWKAFPRLIAEVERLRDESRGYWLDAALLEKENMALKAEVERLRGNRDVPYNVWVGKAELEAEVERLQAELRDAKRGCEIASMNDVCAETRNAWIERAQSRLRDATRLPVNEAAERLVDELMNGGGK